MRNDRRGIHVIVLVLLSLFHFGVFMFNSISLSLYQIIRSAILKKICIFPILFHVFIVNLHKDHVFNLDTDVILNISSCISTSSNHSMIKCFHHYKSSFQFFFSNITHTDTLSYFCNEWNTLLSMSMFYSILTTLPCKI